MGRDDLTFSNSFPAARKWPIFVMQEPINTSSIFGSPISERGFTSSGSFGQAKRGSLISLRSISIVAAYEAFLSGFKRIGFLTQASIFCALLSKVLASPYPSDINHLRSTIFDFKYSTIGSSSKSTVQPEADLSADASDNSKACSIFKLERPSISKHLPEKIFFLFSFSTVKRPCCIAAYGIAFTRSLRVIPGCISPENLTKTDSGISSGITPRAAPKATNPDPAGKLIPIGNLV